MSSPRSADAAVPAAGAAALVVDGVTRRYGARVALDDVSFAIAPGRLCGLVGGNGAGKTTLLRIVAGFLDADRGRVLVDGIDVARRPVAAAGRRGLLVEGAPLPPELAVRDYLRRRAALRRADPAAIDPLLETGGIDARARDPIGSLSKGLRQRVAWIDALLGDPPVLVLDEPASGLDEEERAAVRDRLAALRGARAILWASHELADVDAVADQLVILVAGRVAAAGTPAEVRAAAGTAANAPLRTVVAALTDRDRPRAGAAS